MGPILGPENSDQTNPRFGKCIDVMYIPLSDWYLSKNVRYLSMAKGLFIH